MIGGLFRALTPSGTPDPRKNFPRKSPRYCPEPLASDTVTLVTGAEPSKKAPEPTQPRAKGNTMADTAIIVDSSDAAEVEDLLIEHGIMYTTKEV